MTILAVITIYNPDTALLRKNIASFIGGVEKVLIWRNSPVDETAILEGFPDKIEFCGYCDNAGIPKSLNYARQRALEGGYSHLLTMDQDSVFEDFAGYISTIAGENSPAGIYAPRINGAFGEKKALPEGYASMSFVPYPFLITSGMLIPIELLERIGGWDESFFVDGVDMEFIFHARELGIESYKVAAGNISHHLGDTKRRRFLWKTYTTNNYPPQRLYGLYRSHIIVIRKYAAAKVMAPLFRKQNYRQRPVRILLGEKHRFAKFAAIIRGIRDGRRAKI